MGIANYNDLLKHPKFLVSFASISRNHSHVIDRFKTGDYSDAHTYLVRTYSNKCNTEKLERMR